MPPKIRDLIKELEAARFVNRGRKGSRRNFVNPKVAKSVTLSGNTGTDAKRYREKAARTAIEVKTMRANVHYVNPVERSEEDQCFVGSCPGLFYGGCHGDDEKAVFSELCQISDEIIALYKSPSKPLPRSTCGRDYANKMLNVA